MSEAAPVEAHYALGKHVFLCVCGRDFVLLDLARDKYLSVEAPDAAGLGALIKGWPSATAANAPSVTSRDTESLLAGLVQMGVVTGNVAAGKDATPIAVLPATDELITDIPGEARPGTRMTDAASFMVAALIGRRLRKRLPIEQIVARVRARRERAGLPANDFDIAKAQRLLSVFGSMRSLFLSTRSLCLLESIVLLEFFSRYGIYPRWVFGVQTRPFAAHCWLQHEHLVLNDTAERVSAYTPIMAV
jgi:hypothetical protein